MQEGQMRRSCCLLPLLIILFSRVLSRLLIIISPLSLSPRTCRAMFGECQRVPDVEVVLPFAYGTCAFWLGKKADE